MFNFLKKLFTRPTVDFRQLTEQGAIIVDVRSPQEYRDGHIKGSKNYPLDSIRSKVAEFKKNGKPVITVCRSGARSGIARNILKSAGIEAYNGGPWMLLEHKLQ